MSWSGFISTLLPHKRREKAIEKKSKFKTKRNIEETFKHSTSDESYCDYGDFSPNNTSCSCMDRGDFDAGGKLAVRCDSCAMASKNRDQLNYLQLLPQELIMHILCYLNLESLPSVFRTCKQFQVHSYNDTVWREVCYAKWRERFSSYIPHGPVKPNGRSWKWMARTLRVSSFIFTF